MQLNPVSGNMYDDVDFTQNIIRGKCPFDCTYCYMKKGSRKTIEAYHKLFHIVPAELKGEYPCGKRIFVGSATDMWMAPDYMIRKVLIKLCFEYSRCKGHLHLVFQSKHPATMRMWLDTIPRRSTLITTLETNRDVGYAEISKAPLPGERADEMEYLVQDIRKYHPTLQTSITIEPVLDFDLEEFTEMCKRISPDYVSIGAATLREYDELELPKPSWIKVMQLINELRKCGITVKIKKNLLRIGQNKQRKDEMLVAFKKFGAITKWLEDKDGDV